MRRFSLHRGSGSLVLALAAVAGLGGCSSDGPSSVVSGQSDFVSAPLGGQNGGGADFAGDSAGNAAAPAAAPAAAGGGKSATTPRTVQETDLYRLDGNRLYYLNSYRGLMVFDVTNPDQPALIGRSAIFGDPVD